MSAKVLAMLSDGLPVLPCKVLTVLLDPLFEDMNLKRGLLLPSVNS